MGIVSIAFPPKAADAVPLAVQAPATVTAGLLEKAQIVVSEPRPEAAVPKAQTALHLALLNPARRAVKSARGGCWWSGGNRVCRWRTPHH
jgi:hypothetical protein